MSIPGRLLNGILDEYAEKRRKAVADAEDRIEAVSARVPELADARQRMNFAGIAYARLSAVGRSAEAQAAKQEMSEIQGEIARMLGAHGLSEEALQTVYECPVCQDAGYLPVSDNPGDGGDTPLCKCVWRRYYEVLSGQADSLFEAGEDFLHFDPALYPDEVNPKKYGIPDSPRLRIQANRQRCLDFVETINRPEAKDLLFCGHTGTGKTFLAHCTGREVLRRGYTVFRKSAPRMFDQINRSRFEGGDAYDDLLGADLLILDDLGVEAQSAAKFSTLYDILETRHRHDRRRPMKTILSTNMELKELYRFYDERIGSRLAGWFDVLRFAGDDIRIKLIAQRRAGTAENPS